MFAYSLNNRYQKCAFFRGPGGTGTGSVTTLPVQVTEGGTGADNATDARTNLGLGSIATQNSTNVSITGGTVTGITDIAVLDGGTGASNASGARVNLLPAYSGNGSKVLALNAGATDVEWTTNGNGTVTSVDITVPTGLVVSGGPVTTSGNIDIDFDTGYSIPTDTSQGNWDTAYGWGDHASAGYLTSETFTGTVTSVAATVPTGFVVSGSPITSSGTLAVSFDTGYALPTTASQGNWDTAYGWGDHASAGYLDSGDIGVTVQAYDATILDSADIGVTVQAYDADTAKYDDTTANFSGTLQNGGNTVLTTASTIEGGTY
jgi:hypothetical protein